MQHKQGRGSSVGRGPKERCVARIGPTSKTCECCQAEGTEKHKLYHCSEGKEQENKLTDAVRSCERQAESSKEDWQDSGNGCGMPEEERRRKAKMW